MMTFLLITFFILMIGYFSGIEIGSYTINKIRLRKRSESNDPSAAALAASMKKPQLFIFTTLICQNLFVYLASLTVTNYFLDLGLPESLTLKYGFLPWSAEIIATLTLIFPIFIFGEVWPKLLYRAKADILMYKFVNIQKILILLFRPVTVSILYITDLLTGKRGSEPGSEFDKISISKLKFLMSESSTYGTISREQNEMITNTIELKSIPITGIMLPINKIASFPADCRPEDLLGQFKKRKFDVIPIYRGKRDQIVGVVYFFDLLKALRDKAGTITPYVSEIISMSSTLNIDQVYSEFHSRRRIISTVMTPHNKIIGIIWMKDIIKYITEYSINE